MRVGVFVVALALSLGLPTGVSAQPSAACPAPGFSFSDEVCIVAGTTLQGFLTETGEPLSINIGPIPIPSVLFNSLFPSPGNQVYSIYLTDPGTTQISDVLQMTGGSAPQGQLFLNFLFSSDSDNPSGLPGTLPPACSGPLTPTSSSCSMAETGNLQDVTSSFGLQFTEVNVTVNIPVFIASDVERVPGPGSLLLLGIALAGIASWRRSSRR
jgi:hypothetical protein